MILSFNSGVQARSRASRYLSAAEGCAAAVAAGYFPVAGGRECRSNSSPCDHRARAPSESHSWSSFSRTRCVQPAWSSPRVPPEDPAPGARPVGQSEISSLRIDKSRIGDNVVRPGRHPLVVPGRIAGAQRPVEIVVRVGDRVGPGVDAVAVGVEDVIHDGCLCTCSFAADARIGIVGADVVPERRR